MKKQSKTKQNKRTVLIAAQTIAQMLSLRTTIPCYMVEMLSHFFPSQDKSNNFYCFMDIVKKNTFKELCDGEEYSNYRLVP